MNRSGIFAFLNINRAFSLATTDNGAPRVRTLWLHKADDSGIYFMVGRMKDVYRQLSLNPEIEMCFHDNNIQVRIRGKVENLSNNTELKEEILRERPFLLDFAGDKAMKYMAVYRVVNGTAIIWKKDDQFSPAEQLTL